MKRITGLLITTGVTVLLVMAVMTAGQPSVEAGIPQTMPTAAGIAGVSSQTPVSPQRWSDDDSPWQTTSRHSGQLTNDQPASRG
jgi:hypothetical protein